MLAPLAANAEEAIGSMGNDTPLAVLSERRPLLYSYFKQLFAQVTNPPIDPIREAVVMSVRSLVGSERNLLDETPEHARQLVIDNPILRDDELESLRQVDSDVFKAHTIDITWPVDDGRRRARAGARAHLRRGRRGARRRREHPHPLRPRRRAGARRDPVAARGRRDPPPPRPCRHAAAGRARRRVGRAAQRAERRRPDRLRRRRRQPVSDARDDRPARRRGTPRHAAEDAEERALKAIGKGLLKTISKMGISTLSSYCGAQVFEAVGLSPELIDRHFTGTASRIGGIGTLELAEGALVRHARAYPGTGDELLPVVGLYAWRRDGEHHQWNPETIALLQHAVRGGGRPTYEQFAALVNDDSARRSTLRGLLRFVEREPVPLDEVEPARRDRQALLDRRDVARLALARGARDARRRDEPPRRPLEHR